MDILSVLGLILGVGAILGGNVLGGGHIGSLVNGPAMVIVLGGTLGAVLLQTRLAVFFQAIHHVTWIIFPPRYDLNLAINKIIDWSNMARREGLLGLEAVVETESDPFLAKGVQLLVDGSEPEVIRAVLEVELLNKEDRDLQVAKVFEGMGGYSPTIGIIGAVMGLIHVMENLGDPSKLGSGIATAFVATIYGVGLANMIFLPFANKLKAQAYRSSQYRDMLLEGLVAIAEGENPRNIEAKLNGYL